MPYDPNNNPDCFKQRIYNTLWLFWIMAINKHKIKLKKSHFKQIALSFYLAMIH